MPLRRIALVLFLFVNIALLYGLLLGRHGAFSYLDLKSAYEETAADLQTKEERIISLSVEIRNLKNDRGYVESVIRKEMNYLKDDETMYLFREHEAPGADSL
jgi:cell division protein FtsB